MVEVTLSWKSVIVQEPEEGFEPARGFEIPDPMVIFFGLSWYAHVVVQDRVAGTFHGEITIWGAVPGEFILIHTLSWEKSVGDYVVQIMRKIKGNGIKVSGALPVNEVDCELILTLVQRSSNTASDGLVVGNPFV